LVKIGLAIIEKVFGVVGVHIVDSTKKQFGVLFTIMTFHPLFYAPDSSYAWSQGNSQQVFSKVENNAERF
jgi:hypothetical protein